LSGLPSLVALARCHDQGVDFSVLVVDDDVAFRGLAARLIAGMDIGSVAQAGTCESALAVAMRRRPRAALVDVGLPDGDGVSLAARLAALPWRPRVVLTSSDPDATDATAALRAGAVAFLVKAELADGSLRRLLADREE
jgi:CheY-like chemotaxis protein